MTRTVGAKKKYHNLLARLGGLPLKSTRLALAWYSVTRFLSPERVNKKHRVLIRPAAI
jgi:hypothetical protein